MSKLVAEVDRLLEKGKAPEAIEKLKTGIRSEPLNQLLVTKLANIYVEKGEPKNAAVAYTALATRLSDAGKSQVAIAIFKQAIDLDPLDFDLRIKFANENETCGKIADAHAQGQLVFQHFFKRKKYFDCAGLFPLLVRTQPKDEKLKQLWIEILQLSQAEQKMVHLLVALAGPPGLVSKEFTTGGEPTNLAPQTFEGLKKLVAFFPRDPKIAYTLAWISYKRGADKECYFYLREALRREPDFCLATLLFARVLAEKQKLNESLFVYKFFKERMASDKNTDLLTLNRLMEAFVEGNGWITFTDGMGVEELESATFVSGLVGSKKQDESNDGQESKLAEGVPGEGSKEEGGRAGGTRNQEVAPAEIELGAIEIGLPAADETEILLTSGQTKQISSASVSASAPAVASAPASVSVEVVSAKKVQVSQSEASTETSKLPIQEQPTIQKHETQSVTQGKSLERSDLVDNTGTVEFTSIIKSPLEEPGQSDKPKPVKIFNPLENIQAQAAGPKEEAFADRTQIFSPVDILNANDLRLKNAKSVDTKITLKSAEELQSLAKEQTASAPSIATFTKEQIANNPSVEGEKTQLFSPMESVQAGVDSRRPMQSFAEAPPSPPVVQADLPPSQTSESRSFTATEAEIGQLEQLANEGEATQMLSLSLGEREAMKTLAENEPLKEDRQCAESSSAPESKANVSGPPIPDPPTIDSFAVSQRKADKADPDPMSLPSQSEEVKKAESPLGASSEAAERNTEPLVESIDLGDDLLEERTKPLIGIDNKMEATSVLIEEVRREVRSSSAGKGSSATQLIDTLLKKAERFESKRNYYLARKALKHAQALGANEDIVKSKLSQIRKMEMPDALYLKESKDSPDKRSSDQIIRDLEDEFDLQLDEMDSVASEYAFGESLEAVVETLDLQTTIDFGIGIYEMGLYSIAEKIFLSAVERFPGDTFNSYYLAAISKFAQRDYAGAASILKKISKESMRTEKEKIQIFYALGEVFEKLKRPDQSKEFFQRVAKLDANYRNVRSKVSGTNG